MEHEKQKSNVQYTNSCKCLVGFDVAPRPRPLDLTTSSGTRDLREGSTVAVEAMKKDAPKSVCQ